MSIGDGGNIWCWSTTQGRKIFSLILLLSVHMAMLWIHIHQKHRPGESELTRRGVVAGAQAQTELDKAFIYAACR